MCIRGDVIKFASWRRQAVRILLVAVILRALAPIGYMLDVSAATGGVLKIVICTAGGTKIVAFNADDGGAPQNTKASHEQPCLFAGVVANCGVAQNYTVEKPDATGATRIVVQWYSPIPPARAGPVLGSRAPPAIS